MVAFIPEPHTLLIVVAPVASGSFAPRRSLAGRRLTLSGGKNTAHENFIDSIRRQFRPFKSRADSMRTEIVGAERRKIALKAAKRRANCGYDDDWIG